MKAIDIDLNNFDLISPSSIEKISINNEKFIDINVEDDHTFYVYLNNNDLYLLSHNCDGQHIAGLYIAFFQKYTPSIIKEGRLKKLRTPIICLKDKNKKIKEMFFTFNEFNEYISKNPDHKYNIHYYKGLGSWKDTELKELIAKHGLETFIETLEYDEETDKLVNDWNSKKTADIRKEYLRKNEFSIFGI